MVGIRIQTSDVSDLISVLTAARRERFQFERHASLMTFAAWLHYPGDRDVLQHARTIAGARCYLETGRSNPFATPERLSTALLASPLENHLVDVSSASVNLSNAVTEITSFFVCCPKDKKSSLNRALHFVEQGGFEYPDMVDETDDARSLSTLKIAWRERAATGPFLWASAIADLPDIPGLLPDEVDAFKKVDRIVKKPDQLLHYFGVSKYVQDILLSVLDTTSRHRLYARFPKRLQPVECEFTPFDERQLKILNSYRAPKLI